ncbi:TIP-1 family-domain-containing protein [Phyllosticta citriasiana]|uniref:TIP-1 family-domain-containing protein n=1 Tax=Phyllosticta citriasiana TaxID=595635 RepID=UPI0030FDD8DE
MADLQERAADFLNDKLQTLADLDALDHLLSETRSHHALLKQQLQQAERDAHEARHAANDHASSLRTQHADFQRVQSDVDRRLAIVTRSDTTDDAVSRFRGSMDKLLALDIAGRYTERLKEVDALSRNATTHLDSSDEAALSSYHQLKELNSRLGPLHEAAEGAAPHLIDHISRTTHHVRGQLKDAFAARLETVLKKIGWPKRPETALLGSLHEDWGKSVGNLLQLQKPELEAAENAKPGPVVLLPLEVLVQPLEMRFRYHFYGDKPTNRLDKPEYFLSHIADLLNTFNDFMVANLQPILLERFRGSDLALNTIYIDATCAFITALLPMLRAKIFATLPQAASQPQLLSHWVHEIMNFDTNLREEWRYDGGYGAVGWKGLAWEVLVFQDWFDRWLHVEKEFALSRYQAIIDTPDSGELDYDSVDPGATKPTKAAIRVNDLLETITDRYKPLSSFSQKLTFLIDIQISIFDRFHERLRSSLEAFLTMTSSVGRAVQGISREEQTQLQGIAGLDRLCRVYGSADYLERAMRDWSDDVFFLELWEELQDRARRSTSAKLGRALDVSTVAERTSSTVGTDDEAGALFDETASAYNRLRVRSESVIIDVLVSNIREALRPYTRVNPWTTLSTATGSSSSVHLSPSSPLSITAELDPLLTSLSSSLAFLAKTLARAPLRRIARHCCAVIQTQLWDRVLMAHSFSTAGAAQFSADIAAICDVVDHWAGDGCAGSGLRKIREGVGLLGLPVRGARGSASSLANNEPSDEGDAEAEKREDSDDAKLGLWEVEQRVFADNEKARAVLEELGFDSLSETEARHVLERRVELGS